MLVVICTLESSGSTWLNKLLGAYPGATWGPETRLFHGMAQQLRRMHSGLHGWRSPEETVDSLRGYAEAMLGMNKRDLVVEKTPGHWQYLPQLHRLWPDARFVWLSRDKEAHVRSMLTKQPKRTREHFELEHDRFMRGMSVWERTGKYRIHPVAYEELLASPNSTLRRLLIALGLDPGMAGAMLHVHRPHTPKERAAIDGRKSK